MIVADTVLKSILHDDHTVTAITLLYKIMNYTEKKHQHID